MKKAIGFAVVGVMICALAVTTITKTTRVSKALPPFQEGGNLSVDNKTRAFQIVTAVRDGDIVRLSFRNGYAQAINAFTLSGGPNSGVEVDLLYADHEIALGKVYDYRAFASNLEPSGSSVKPLKLTILNVVFEDGTGDGDPQATADINNRRTGERIVLTRILPLLDQALQTSNLETPEGMRQLKERIVAACETLEKEQPAELRGGILHGKGHLLGDIERVETQRRVSGSIDFRGEMLKVKERYEKESAKFGKSKISLIPTPHSN
jgi:hypothetical protein